MSTTSSLPEYAVNALQGSTVLVTGASGFIGGHLIRTLKEIGAQVIATDRKPSTGIHGADVSVAEQVQQIFKTVSSNYGKSVEYIFHLAGQKSASLARENPAETLKTSFNGNLHILESARKLGTVKKVVLISSLAVYGLDEDGSSKLVKESDPVHNDSIYAATKISTESVGLSYCKDFGVPVAIARLANVYGPHQPAVAVIPSMIQQMQSTSGITLGNTAAVRDFIHVRDVVSALLALAVHDSTTGKIFNVGTSQGTSIQALTEILSRLLNYTGEISVDERKVRKNEKKFLIADHSELKNKTGWAPQINLEDGLKELCQ